VPIFDTDGNVLAAVGIAGAPATPTIKAAERHVPRLQEPPSARRCGFDESAASRRIGIENNQTDPQAAPAAIREDGGALGHAPTVIQHLGNRPNRRVRLQHCARVKDRVQIK